MSFTCAQRFDTCTCLHVLNATRAVSASDTACSSCGVSYLIHSEVTALQRRVAAAEAQVTNWADRISRVEATEGERDSWKGEATRLEREASSMRAAARGESDRLDAARASARTEAADEARRLAAQSEERFRSRLEAESSRWRALQSAVLSGSGLDLAETAAGLRDELRGLRASALAATAGGVEAAAAARRSVAAYIERSIKVRKEGRGALIHTLTSKLPLVVHSSPRCCSGHARRLASGGSESHCAGCGAADALHAAGGTRLRCHVCGHRRGHGDGPGQGVARGTAGMPRCTSAACLSTHSLPLPPSTGASRKRQG